MNVIDRIEQAPACDVINLSDAEKNLYTGAGWKLARFLDGQLVGFFDPAETEYREGLQEMADDALENAMAWIANATGDVWLVMCSCYQLCDPRRISLTDAASLAYLARIVGETITEMEE